MMYIAGIVFVLSCLVLRVSALRGEGLTFMCQTCDHVKDPSACSEYVKCHEDEMCVTEVHMLHNEYIFTKGCKGAHHGHVCDPHAPLFGRRGKRRPGDKGQLMCQECCHTSGCGRDLCSKYLPAVNTQAPMITTLVDSSCRDYESATFQCAEFEKYNFCTDNSSVGYVIAHEKCARHCGFCTPYWVVYHETAKPMIHPTDIPTTTIISHDHCADKDDPSLTCPDMLKFGFCSSDSGAGYMFAQQRCRKTCQFCGN